MLVDVYEATGKALDYLVALAEREVTVCLAIGRHDSVHVFFAWSNPDKVDGYKVIEREGISVAMHRKRGANSSGWWGASTGHADPKNRKGHWASGSTYLIAGLRCYVISKLGAAVEVPDEVLL